MQNVRLWCALAAFVLSVCDALAQVVVIGTPTRIEVGQNSIQTPGGPVLLSNADLIVRGTTLTINGPHFIRSLTVERSGSTPGIVTHDPAFTQGMQLTLAFNLVVQGSVGGVASRIDASGRGWPGGAGPGAGQPGTGGFGGSGAGYAGSGTARGIVPFAQSYGSHTQTTDSGSGGGALGPNPGGAGGGRVSIIAEGTVQLDGEVLCDGEARSSGAGAGSGGSVEIRGTTFVGSGLIRASGGNSSGGGGAGSGGRIIVRGATTYAFTGALVAAGGLDSEVPALRAAGGTIYVDRGGPLNVVRVDAGGLPVGSSTSFVSPIAGSLEVANGGFARFTQGQNLQNLTMQGNARLALQQTNMVTGNLLLAGSGNVLTSTIAGTTLTLQINGSTSIDAGSEINLDGMGLPGGQGQGAGFRRTAAEGGAGAGHGGRGTPDGGPNAGGVTYGDIRQPTTPGSGGGAVEMSIGGAGGGALRLISTQPVTLNGAIRANGLTGQGLAGSGSGGAVYIQAPSFAGAGLVQTNGGGGEGTYGGGGGGRIGINATTIPFTGTYEAFGGLSPLSSPGRGGAGTVFLAGNGDPLITQIIIDNGGLPIGARTNVITTASARDITIRNGADVEFQSVLSGPGTFLMAGNSVARLSSSMSFNQGMILRNAGNILTSRSAGVSPLNITGPSMVIDAGSGIVLDALGSGAQAGSGAGRPSNGPTVGASGAGYGGIGGGLDPVAGGNVHGSPVSPFELGSGGGNGSPTNLGGAGGGGVRLSFQGAFTFNGFITVNGGSATGAAGGGSGGSINISAGSLTGNGSLAANGGNAVGLGGGGGGGRIAVSANSGSFTGTMSAFGGASGTPLYPRAGAGTIYTRFGTSSTATTLTIDAGSATLAAPTKLLSSFPVHNVNVANGANLERFINSSITGSVNVSGGSRLAIGVGPQFINGNLTLSGLGSTIAPIPNSGVAVELFVDGNLRIDPDCSIIANGTGFSGGSGAGAGRPATAEGQGGSGGGFGGAGAASGTALGGVANGDPWRPFQAGSGGGPGMPSQLNPGGAGGGRISLDVDGVLTNDGTISANGISSVGTGGGGSGGGILVRATVMTGNGLITANGAPAGLGQWGAGGGGRVLVRSCSNTFPASNIFAAAGATSGEPAQAGTVLLGSTLVINTQPFNQTVVRGDDITLTVEAPTATEYQWRRRGPGGFFVNLADDGRITGTRTSTLVISHSRCDDEGEYDCIVTDGCGSAVTAVPVVMVDTPADHNRDGSVDGDDVIAYFADWDAGVIAADFNGDGGVDADDVIDFFASWDVGC